MLRSALVVLALSAAGAAAAADSTLFDLEKDLAKFFALQSEVIATEPNPHDTPAEAAKKQAARAAVFRRYGIRDEKHWARENDIAMRWSWTKKAQRIYGGEEAIADMRRAAETTMVLGVPLWIPYAAMVPGLALAGLTGLIHPFSARTASGGAA